MGIDILFYDTRLPFVTCVRFFYSCDPEYSFGNSWKHDCGTGEELQSTGATMHAKMLHHILNNLIRRSTVRENIVRETSLFTKRKKAGCIIYSQQFFEFSTMQHKISSCCKHRKRSAPHSFTLSFKTSKKELSSSKTARWVLDEELGDTTFEESS